MIKEIKGTTVLKRYLQSTTRYVLSVGSSRSSKSYSLMQYFIIYCAQNQNKGEYISIVRASFPSLRRTVIREFVDMLKDYGIYDESKHNKTENVIEVFGNYIEFFSLSDSQKIRGARRNHLWINECTEVDYESAQQLFLRTEGRIWLDMNPSDIYGWYWKLKDDPKCTYIHSTYKDNGYLSQETIDQIESYKNTDENFYRVFALGLPGFATTTIYTHQKEYKDSDIWVKSEDGKDQPVFDSIVYGLDVGFSHEMALTKCYFRGDKVWVEEVIYRSGLTSNDLIKLMNSMNIDKDKDIWVDAAAPTVVEDLKRAGYNAKSADKSVKEGIDLIKSKELYINSESTNLISEMRRYQWKTKGEQIIYEPVKLHDDLCDSMRYGIWNYYRITKKYDDNDLDFDVVFL